MPTRHLENKILCMKEQRTKNINQMQKGPVFRFSLGVYITSQLFSLWFDFSAVFFLFNRRHSWLSSQFLACNLTIRQLEITSVCCEGFSKMCDTADVRGRNVKKRLEIDRIWPFELFESVCDVLLVILIYNNTFKIFCFCMLKWGKKLALPFLDANALLRVVSILRIFMHLLL